MGPTLVVPDLHARFTHRNALKFCEIVFEKYKCKRVVCTGDIIDHHRMSRHTAEPNADGAEQEKQKTIAVLKKWYKSFPSMDIVFGNHDLIPYRQAKEIGIPASFLRKLADVYEMPKDWEFHKELCIDGVLYLHKLGSGLYGAINEAKKRGMSVVGSHTHTAGGCIYFRNHRELLFGLNAGCLIDINSYAMTYSNSLPTLGCGVVIDRHEAYYVPMRYVI